MAQFHSSFFRRHRRLTIVVGTLLVAFAALLIVASVLARHAEPFLRALLVDQLQNRFNAHVELDSFHISVAGGLRAEGKGLRIWPPAQQPGAPASTHPLISLDSFRFHAPLRYRRGRPLYIPIIQLNGLQIHLPPRSHLEHPSAVAPQHAPALAQLRSVDFSVGQIDCTNAELVLETNKPGKLPLDFQIAHLKLIHPSATAGMAFEALLTNPRPVGTIHTTGTFGPWNVSDPGLSPIAGEYRFDHADLSVFRGIAGILNSTGQYQGVLRDITADGQADVPDFRLTHYGTPVPLHTRFHAHIDGTDGDTHLDPVDAVLGRSQFTAQGGIVRVTAPNPDGTLRSIGHDIALDIDVKQAPLEDFLRLASSPDKTTPLLTGTLAMKAHLHIPPGPMPVHMRIALDGSFNLTQAHFTSDKFQSRIADLSLRGQGRPGDIKATDPNSISSAMQGEFKLGNGSLTLPKLSFTVPGALISLSGTYELDGGSLNFTGAAKMDATVSKMLGGWKGLLLKPADRYFRKNGVGTDVPIHIEGTREQPKFGIDFDRMKSR